MTSTAHHNCDHPATKAARTACRREKTRYNTDMLVTHCFVWVRQARSEGFVNTLAEITLYEIAQRDHIEDWDFKLACRMVRDTAHLMNEWDLLAPEMLQVKR